MMNTRSWSEMASSFVRVVVVLQQKEKICATLLRFNGSSFLFRSFHDRYSNKYIRLLSFES